MTSSRSLRRGSCDSGPTIIDLFVAGYDEVTFEQDPLNPEGEFINTRHSWMQRGKSQQSDAAMGQSATYIPDPPCIMPLVKNEFAEKDSEEDDVPKLDVYWKNFASWLEQWPSIRQYREVQDRFCNLWRRTPSESRLRAFVVITANSVGMRVRPGLEEEEKNGQVLRTGQCIPVESIEVTDENRFLKLPGPGAGWVFEYKDGERVMAEMKDIEVGMWWYKCAAQRPLEIRKAPIWEDTARSGFVLSPQEFAVVNIRCKLNGYQFFHLFDGRGWVFELIPGTPKNTKYGSNVVMHECECDFAGREDVHVLQSFMPATNEVVEVGRWTYVTNLNPVLALGSRRYGQLLAPGSVVQVDKRANSSGNPRKIDTSHIKDRLWLRLADGSGWVPETDESGKKLLLLQSTDEVGCSSWSRTILEHSMNELTSPLEAGVV